MTLPDDDNGQGQGADVTQAYVYFNISIVVPSDIKISGTRADALHTDFRGNPVDEHAVQNVTVFVVDYDINTGEDDWSNCEYSNLLVSKNEAVYSQDDDTYTINLRYALTVSNGPKHVYASANLSNELIEQCARTGKFQPTSAQNDDDYYEIISKFIDRESGAIAMFCSDRVNIMVDNESCTDGVGTVSNPYNYSFNLQCMLSKVLLTCDMADNDHVALKANIDEKYAENFKGWMKIANVRYRLATTNRTGYFFMHTDTDGNVIDPNYYVADQLSADNRSDEWLYNENYANDFSYSSSSESDFSSTSCMQAVRYDAQRMPNTTNDANAYTEGMYCLENTTDNNWSAISGYETYLNKRSNWFIGPRKIATCIDIETRYIPAVIVGKDCISKKSDYDINSNLPLSQRLDQLLQLNPYCFCDDDNILRNQPAQFAGAAESAAENFIISESSDPSSRLATFYSLYIGNCFYFFTYQAVQEIISLANQCGLNGYFTSDLSPFTTYKDGLAYYHTYLSRITDENPNQSIAGLVRNNYYILRCTYMSIPPVLDNAAQQAATYSRAIW